MSFITASKNAFSVKAYVGDKKTLLAFNFSNKENAKSLAGFTIFCQPPRASARLLSAEHSSV